MANSSLLQSVHAQFLSSSEAFVPATTEVWELANNFYAMFRKQGRKALFRSKSVAPDYQGNVVTVSLMESPDGDYLTVALHQLGTEDAQFIGIGFASVNTDEGFAETGIFAGGKLNDNSPLRDHGYTRHQLVVRDQVMSLIVF